MSEGRFWVLSFGLEATKLAKTRGLKDKFVELEEFAGSWGL